VAEQTTEEPLGPPLAEWKLAAPHARPGVVMRPRLFALLNRHADAALTLITAPPGSGKTELLASWLEAHPELSVAWVSLDVRDSDPRRFWTYVAHAVDRVRPGMARPSLARLRTPGVAIEEAIDALISGIATFAGQLVVAIDDIHHFASGSWAVSLAYAVDHLAPPARIVATTRVDPVIRLSRLRARGAVTDLRADQLAFTVAESKELIVEGMGVELTAEDLEELVQRTEGWPAGLSLAGLWLGEVEDPSAQVRSFSGHHRQVADYLTDEVLGALDEETRNFLVRASVFERLSGPLCDAVLGTEGSDKRLEALARSNLFVVPLDRRGEWYRYHQLFRDLLALELSRQDTAISRRLHERAATWFVEHEMLEEALEHTAATGNPAAVSGLLAEQYLALVRSNRVDMFVGWLEWLPDHELLENPVLAAAGVLALMISGQPVDERAARFLQVAQTGARTKPAPVQLRVEITAALIRAGVMVDDLSQCVKSGRRAVELALGGDDELVAGALAILAYALYLQGDDLGAEEVAKQALERPEAPQRPHAVIYALACTALVESDRGHIHAAELAARRSLEATRRLGLGGVTAGGLARLAMGQVLLASGSAAEAERQLERAEVLRRSSRPTLEHLHALILLAQARAARGRLLLGSTELDMAFEGLDSFSDAGRLAALADRVKQSLASAQATTSTPVEPPTPSELSVLRLLSTDLTQRQIAHELFVSYNTVKTHTRNLYRKLGATTRSDAVRRASEVGLLR
jgi:LuxR family maltose regulon positive regulatory protein